MSRRAGTVAIRAGNVVIDVKARDPATRMRLADSLTHLSDQHVQRHSESTDTPLAPNAVTSEQLTAVPVSQTVSPAPNPAFSSRG